SSRQLKFVRRAPFARERGQVLRMSWISYEQAPPGGELPNGCCLKVCHSERGGRLDVTGRQEWSGEAPAWRAAPGRHGGDSGSPALQPTPGTSVAAWQRSETAEAHARSSLQERNLIKLDEIPYDFL